jgi:putative ABC transport system ATP-binding protein
MDPAAVLADVSKSFTVGAEVVVALDDVDLAARPSELVCVYGASGSGKTTMLNVLAGIATADSGTVEVAGQRLSGASEALRARVRLHHVGVIFQANNLLPEFSARENVVLPQLVRGVARATADKLASEALTSVGLGGLEDRLPHEMSGGQRQRVGIARALSGGQSVIVADEPTGALDSENSLRLFTLLRDMCRRHGAAVVVATHDPLAHDVADSVYDMVDGRLTPR